MACDRGGGEKGELEAWEQEVLAPHRWGRLSRWFETDEDRPQAELVRLRKFWKRAQPLDDAGETIAGQIAALEICNWNLEESIVALCQAIGQREPTNMGIGHMASMTEERWKRIWAYYLTLKNWLPCEIGSGYRMLLKDCDPEGTIQNQVAGWLGDRDDLKELYVQRFCLCLEFWLGGYLPRDSAQRKTHEAAVLAVEKEIRRRDPEGRILEAFKQEGDGKLNLCHHKVFRRYDIIISSIGSSQWRAALPMRGTDGLDRAATLDKFLSPVQAWIDGRGEPGEDDDDELFAKIQALLGRPDNTKLFLASLLVSLLRSQQLPARRLAEKRSSG